MLGILNIASSIASILGFLLTVYIAWKIRFIKNKAQGIAQINDIKKQITNISTDISSQVPFFAGHDSNGIVYRFESVCDLVLKYRVFSQMTVRSAKNAKKVIKAFTKTKNGANWDRIFEFSIKLRSGIESDTKDIPFEGVE
jgi:hypothetical protein